MSAKKSVMVFIQQTEGAAADVSLELVCKARELAGRLGVKTSAAFLGEGIRDEAKRVASYGVDEMILAEHTGLAEYTPVPYAKVMTEIIKKQEPQIVLYGATTTGRDLAPRIASALRVGLTADCTDLQIGDHEVKDKTFKDILFQIRPAFGGNIIATIVSPENLPQMATVREGVMRLTAADPLYKTAYVDFAVDLKKEDFPSEIIQRVREAKRVNLKGAQIVVSGGIGVGTKENFDLIVRLAHTLGAEIGASRAAVDAGFVGKEHQVGQTGTTVRPKLYIACGISGSIQHRAGMAESSRIIAINNDPDAPIFQIAHYGIVGDLKEVIPRFIKAYKEKA